MTDCAHPILQCRWDTWSGKPFGYALGIPADHHTIYCTSCGEVQLEWVKGKGVLTASGPETPPKQALERSPRNNSRIARPRVRPESGGL